MAVMVLLNSCTVSYSFSQGSIPPEIRTVSISRFQNNALLVAPILSSTFTETLQDKFSRETRLTQVREGGDLHFEGEITNYTSIPASIAAGTDQATQNRLTITVRVRFTNNFDPSASFDKSFSAFADYPTGQTLQGVESTLIPEISQQLADEIFNAALSNW